MTIAMSGEPAMAWLPSPPLPMRCRRPPATIGLLHGMFEGNILTFNPGLTNRMERLESYEDVRTIQASLEGEGVALQTRAEGEAGPASITLSDPDGNAVLIDQFF